MFATIYGANSPLARCSRCGSQKQFHGRVGHYCTNFTAETIHDIDAPDLNNADLYRAISWADKRYGELTAGSASDPEWDEAEEHSDRAKACRAELQARVKATFGLEWDALMRVMEG